MPSESRLSSMEYTESVDTSLYDEELNLSHHNLDQLEKCKSQQITALILDHNKLTRLDNVESYGNLQKLSVSYNGLIRMYSISRLYTLKYLDLSNNNIVSIEGLRDMIHLKYLNLSGNNLKILEHLMANINLEHLDVSHNSILKVCDLSHMINLKVGKWIACKNNLYLLYQRLHLHSNRINSLKWCERFFPLSLEVLTLANNRIADLTELCYLRHLTVLQQLSIMGNPCVQGLRFDFRPFVINWCLSLSVLDKNSVSAKECLKAEWLYSQGKGRSFAPGEFLELCEYLLSVCPLERDMGNSHSEDERLMRILSKAKQHQKELQTLPRETIKRSLKQKTTKLRATPLRRHPKSTLQESQASFNFELPTTLYGTDDSGIDLMTQSCIGSLSLPSHIVPKNDQLMTQSLDSYALTLTLDDSSYQQNGWSCHRPSSLQVAQHSNCSDISTLDVSEGSVCSQLSGMSQFVPAPESILSPDLCPSNISNKYPASKQMKFSINSSQSLTQLFKRDSNMKNSPSVKKTPSSAPPLTQANHSKTVTAKRSPGTRVMAQVLPDCHLNKDAENSDYVENDISAINLMNIKHTGTNTHQKQIKEQAAILIQKIWRGYAARNLNSQVLKIYQQIQIHRAEEHICKLMNDLEETKSALEREKQLRSLQTDAIRALWQEIQSFHLKDPINLNEEEKKSFQSKSTIEDLTQTCSLLQEQVQNLQLVLQQLFQKSFVKSRSTNTNAFPVAIEIVLNFAEKIANNILYSAYKKMNSLKLYQSSSQLNKQ